MTCNWDSLLKILPGWLRRELQGMERSLLELRLRLSARPELITGRGSFWPDRPVTREDLQTCLSMASRHSPWTVESVTRGYLTAEGGHRIGICGVLPGREKCAGGIRSVESLCVRVARDHPGIASGIPHEGSVLILGAPGWGKTTLLRDLLRQRAERETVAVVDQRGELFPHGFARGKRMDVLTGEDKQAGILRLLCTMSPQLIGLDEITRPEDCGALLEAARCGAGLAATAHAGSVEDLHRRELYRKLVERGLFQWCVMLDGNRGYTVERMVS